MSCTKFSRGKIKITEKFCKYYSRICNIYRNVCEKIFTETVIFTETFCVTLLPKQFCKIYRSFITVYVQAFHARNNDVNDVGESQAFRGEGIFLPIPATSNYCMSGHSVINFCHFQRY
jgi:hypothetical protein